MARIRTIKPEFWQDEKLAPLDPLTRLVFLGLISQADDAGRLVDSVRLIDGLLFPMTDDTCADALVKLHELGVIERGVTASGQRVIQIVNWEKHQKVEKPNLKSALDPIVIADTSAKRRRSVPPALRMAIIERDGGVCQECGVEVKVYKDDRYDSDPRLAEIDHIIPVADGGTNDPQNLRLLCLACNRKRAGEDAPRRFAETSGKPPRNVGETSPTHTNDQRSTTMEEDVTGAKAPEAAPRGEVARTNGRGAPAPTSEQPIDRKAVAATLAPIIREHLWLGDEPPRVSGSETWDMGRDLSIAFGFLDRGEVTLDELAGAITVARRTLGLSRDRPLTMRIFQVAGRRDRLHECIAAWRKAERASGRIGVILGDLMGGVHVAAS